MTYSEYKNQSEACKMGEVKLQIHDLVRISKDDFLGGYHVVIDYNNVYHNYFTYYGSKILFTENSSRPSVFSLGFDPEKCIIQCIAYN